MAGGASPIALAAALPAELAFVSRLGRFRSERTGGMECQRGAICGVETALLVSGMGGGRAYETAKTACASIRPRAYISVGFSAALIPGLGPGAVVVGESTTINGGPVYPSDAALLRLAGEALGRAGGVRFGPLTALPEVAVTADEKKAVAKATGCLALDMESFGAARGAGEAGVPFLAVRAISDALDEDLPVDFNRFVRGGGMDWPRFLLHVAAHPGAVPGLAGLAMRSRMAARKLARALERLLSGVRQD